LLSRKLLRAGDAQDAYDVIAAHGQSEPAIVVEGEFLAGFIALRRLNDPVLAARHFTALAAASPAVLTQSRAYYGSAGPTRRRGATPRPRSHRSAGWPMTFTGNWQRVQPARRMHPGGERAPRAPPTAGLATASPAARAASCP